MSIRVIDTIDKTTYECKDMVDAALAIWDIAGMPSTAVDPNASTGEDVAA